MKFVFAIPLLSATLAASLFAADVHNTLSAAEKADGWTLLFDGKNMIGFTDPAALTPPGDGWTIEDGCLKTRKKPNITEDLVSKDTYRDFELVWDWRISAGGNSGVKYRIQGFPILTEATRKPGAKRFEELADYAVSQHNFDRGLIPAGGKGQIYVVGFEYQMIDNQRHPDAKRGPLYQSAALYSIEPPTKDVTKPVGEFNHSRLIVKGNHVEQWLNGEKVVDTMLDSAALKETLAHRWSKESPIYLMMVNQPKKDCPISLQNHGDEAWFRDIKIRKL